MLASTLTRSQKRTFSTPSHFHFHFIRLSLSLCVFPSAAATMKSKRGSNISTTSSTSSTDELEYPTASITVKVCGPLYQEWSAKKSLYKNAPAEGIPVTIEYADTLGTLDNSGRQIDSSSPIVVCLHGAPGSHRDFKHFIKDMQETGHRVIVPNFPSEYPFSPATDVPPHLKHLLIGFSSVHLQTTRSQQRPKSLDTRHSRRKNTSSPSSRPSELTRSICSCLTRVQFTQLFCSGETWRVLKLGPLHF